jgi:hypothetical protein
MLDIEKFKKIIKSNNFQEIVKESKEAYNYLLFKDNRIDLYNEIFSTLDELKFSILSISISRGSLGLIFFNRGSISL